MTREIARKCDMGSGMKMQLFIEEDGDVIVTVLPQDHRITTKSVEFCASGTQSPATTTALHALYKAMKQDEADRPQEL